LKRPNFLDTITFGIRISAYESWTDTNIQTLALADNFKLLNAMVKYQF
jgi:hypothetical protein